MTEIRNEIRFILNGADIALADIAPDATLLDWLRLNRSLRGTKEGCAEGDCGACTVLVGKLSAEGLVYESVNACIRFMGSLDGTHVVTVEHLRGEADKLHPVQQAMVDFHGSQCGFCTPGFIMSLYALWMKTPNPSDAAIEKALQGNLCRCTGYEAIMRAARAISSYGKAAKDPLAVERKDITTRLQALRDGKRVEVGSGRQRLIVPANVDDFAAILEKEPGATIVAGSTDVGLWVTKQMRDISPAIFIGSLDGLRAMSETDGVITIGAGVTYTEAFDTLSKRIPALGPLVDRIGGEQVRNMGTIGGNIANGSPIGAFLDTRRIGGIPARAEHVRGCQQARDQVVGRDLVGRHQRAVRERHPRQRRLRALHEFTLLAGRLETEPAVRARIVGQAEGADDELAWTHCPHCAADLDDDAAIFVAHVLRAGYVLQAAERP